MFWYRNLLYIIYTHWNVHAGRYSYRYNAAEMLKEEKEKAISYINMISNRFYENILFITVALLRIRMISAQHSNR